MSLLSSFIVSHPCRRIWSYELGGACLSAKPVSRHTYECHFRCLFMGYADGMNNRDSLWIQIEFIVPMWSHCLFLLYSTSKPWIKSRVVRVWAIKSLPYTHVAYPKVILVSPCTARIRYINSSRPYLCEWSRQGRSNIVKLKLQ